MCGIAGEVNFGRTPALEAVGAMNDVMAGRGPDGAGVWVSDYAVLGHRRLAVIDPEGGHQPMVHESDLGRVAITFAGEVYNHPELRRELRERGHEFRGDSDTEVVLKDYLEHGDRTAGRLRGMFGLAIWDGRRGRNRLLMMRDGQGVKPLYYHPTAEGVIFGSVPEAILAHPDVHPSVGLSGWRDLFAVIRVPGNAMWGGIREVEPGHVVTIDQAGIRDRTFWRLESQPHSDDTEATIAHTRRLLEAAVSEQMVADVPLGAMLSGGLDSSVNAALAARYRADRGMGRLATYAIDLTGQAQDSYQNVLQTSHDAPFAEEVAAMWDTDHTRFVIDSVGLASRALRERLVRIRGMMPSAIDGHASRLLLFERIRQHSTVTLSGEMADELFGGYPIFYDSRSLEGDGWPWRLYAPEAHADQLQNLNPAFRSALDVETYAADMYADAVREIGRVAGESPREHRLRQINYLEATRRIRILLDFTDRLSAAVGLEMRVPFCDPRLMEYVFNTPWDIKAPGGDMKGLLKRAAAGLLPASVINRQKSPYPSTPHPGYLRELQRQALDLASRPSHRAFELISREWLLGVAQKTPSQSLTLPERYGLDQALDLEIWLDMYRPTLTTH